MFAFQDTQRFFSVEYWSLLKKILFRSAIGIREENPAIISNERLP